MSSDEQHLRLFREQAPVGVIEWDTDFRVVSWNKAAENIFGYTSAEIEGRAPFGCIFPDYIHAEMRRMWAALMAQSGGEKSVSENVAKDGRAILCEWYNSAISDDAGVVIGVATIVIDITVKHQARQALIDKDVEHQEILDFMLEAIITMDDSSKILSFNKSAEAMFGYSAAEVIGQSVHMIMPESFAKNHDAYMQHYKDTGERRIIGIGREVEGLRKNEESFPLSLAVAELPLGDEGQHRFIASCSDLTQQRKQDELLHRMQKMDALGQLTGGITHDYNNMLGVIAGYSGLLLRGLGEQPKLYRYTEEIQRAVDRGAALTQKLLSFSRKGAVKKILVNINELLRGELNLLEKTLTVRVELVCELAEDLWLTWLDVDGFKDVLLNLSINAMHAMSGRGQLTIQSKNVCLDRRDARMLNVSPGDYVLISVADVGSGMDAATKEKIFDPFYSTKGDKGTGLGLSQVFRFMVDAGGVVDVDSTLKQGSKFMLFFPRDAGVKKDVQAEAKFVENDFVGKETILIVDDEAALRDITTENLGRLGYKVMSADGVAAALTVLEAEAVDLVISDIIMPDIDGYRLVEIVQEKYPAVKIQLVSGFDGQKPVGKSLLGLKKNMLNKPYTAHDLLKKVRGLLDA